MSSSFYSMSLTKPKLKMKSYEGSEQKTWSILTRPEKRELWTTQWTTQPTYLPTAELKYYNTLSLVILRFYSNKILPVLIWPVTKSNEESHTVSVLVQSFNILYLLLAPTA